MNIKTLLADPGNHGGSRDVSKIRYIVVHYTGNDGDTAANNAKYFHDRRVGASAHYFVDDDFVWQSVPDGKVAWSVGGQKYANCDKTGGGTMHGIITNANSISVEMCDTLRNGTYQATQATLQNAWDLIRLLMKQYNIPIENVYRHFDVTGKHCPSYLINASKWADFKSHIMQDNFPGAAHKAGVEWAISHGIIAGGVDGDLMLHKYVTREQMCTMLHRFYKLIGGD